MKRYFIRNIWFLDQNVELYLVFRFFSSFIKLILIFYRKLIKCRNLKMHFVASLGFISDGIFFGAVHWFVV